MRKMVLCVMLLSVTFAQNIVADSDSTKPIALDAVEVLANNTSITNGMFLRNAEPSDVVSKTEQLKISSWRSKSNLRRVAQYVKMQDAKRIEILTT